METIGRPVTNRVSGGRWLQRRALWILFGIVGLVLVILLAFRLSPWPMALLIRFAFDRGSAATSAALVPHVPDGVNSVLDEVYRAGDPSGLLDVYYPTAIEGTDTALPAIVWVHGGGFVSGDKGDIANYLKILASYGYTTVSVGYSIAPEHNYPLPPTQVNDALAYLQENAARLHIDPDRFVLAGDSAGAHIVAQLATIITNPAYAEQVGIAPTLPAARLVGMLLNCGAYDMALANFDGPFGPIVRAMLWSYSGSRNFLTDPVFQLGTVTAHVTADFPPAFITVGNGDPLRQHSYDLAARLAELGVVTDTLFYPDDHEPPLPHIYQFNLDIQEGQMALAHMTSFLETHAGAPIQE